jgi:hypothetical protein
MSIDAFGGPSGEMSLHVGGEIGGLQTEGVATEVDTLGIFGVRGGGGGMGGGNGVWPRVRKDD